MILSFSLMIKYYFCFCFQSFKDIKMFLAHRCYKNRQQTGYSPYASLSTPNLNISRGLPWWSRGKESTCHCRKQGFHSWSQRCHMPWGNYAHGPQLPNLHSRAWECNYRSPWTLVCTPQEKPPRWEGFSPWWGVAFHLPQPEKSLCVATKIQCSHTHTHK